MKKHGSEWIAFDLATALKNTKSSKKVIFTDRFRNHATIRAIKGAALLSEGDFGAGFSIIDNTDIISSVDTHQLKGTRRQLSHYSKAPEWRNTTQELEAIFYQLAIHEKESQDQSLIQRPFTINLTPEFTQKATNHKNGLSDYCKRRIDKALKNEFNRIPQYWFTVEFAPISTFTKGYFRPHLHGAILLHTEETFSKNHQKTPISRAFHKAVGNCSPDFNNRIFNLGSHQKHAQEKSIPLLYAKVGWAGYCFKHQTFAKLILDKKRNLMSDNLTKQQAKDIYSKLASSPKPKQPIPSELEAFLASIK